MCAMCLYGLQTWCEEAGASLGADPPCARREYTTVEEGGRDIVGEEEENLEEGQEHVSNRCIDAGGTPSGLQG